MARTTRSNGISMPYFAAFLRVVGIHGVPLLPILALGYAQFVGLAATLRPLTVLFFFRTITLRLDRAT